MLARFSRKLGCDPSEQDRSWSAAGLTDTVDALILNFTSKAAVIYPGFAVECGWLPGYLQHPPYQPLFNRLPSLPRAALGNGRRASRTCAPAALKQNEHKQQNGKEENNPTTGKTNLIGRRSYLMFVVPLKKEHNTTSNNQQVTTGRSETTTARGKQKHKHSSTTTKQQQNKHEPKTIQITGKPSPKVLMLILASTSPSTKLGEKTRELAQL